MVLVVFFFQSSIAREIARRKECTPENERKDDGVLDAKRFCVRAVAVDDDVEQPSDDATRLDDDTKKFFDARRMLVVVFARARVQQRRRFVVRVFL
tara:strand:- start:187 stop:474 length:288 start_codon:yes stop_codon:yes gene_type:complete